ncbi:hypothetical protein AVEN_211059-1 [Araneus ventricosus]|uniref:Uncharacterized protein n=1 Tax=Araneus ventricosus TaxID=182803 RepID=A0A4Y2MTM6_ARAVE|nr:hypothetical protein AVEN_211059-1 [Araneus ventricosus]
MLEIIFSFPCLDLKTPRIRILYDTNVICRRSENSLRIPCSSWLHFPPLPTSATTKQHFCRAYNQVQQWLNEQKDPLKRCWKTIAGHFRAITTHAAAPDDLLFLIVCTCKMNASKTVSVEGVVLTAQIFAAIAQDLDASSETL